MGCPALPPAGGRVIGRPARRRRERRVRPGRLGRRLRPAAPDRRREVAPRTHRRHRHARSRPGPARAFPRTRPSGRTSMRGSPFRDRRRRMPGAQLTARPAGPSRGSRSTGDQLRARSEGHRRRGLGRGPDRRRRVAVQRRCRPGSHPGSRDVGSQVESWLGRPRSGGGPPGIPLPLGRGPGRLAALDRPRSGPPRIRWHRPDGPPHPDPAGGPGLGADSRAMGDAGPARRARHEPPARHPRHSGDLPRAWHHRENRCHS